MTNCAVSYGIAKLQLKHRPCLVEIGSPTVSHRFLRQFFAPMLRFTMLQRELSHQTKGLVLPAWTSSVGL